MKQSMEQSQLENSIKNLVSSLTDFMNSMVQTAINQAAPALTKQPTDSTCKYGLPPGFIGSDGVVAAAPPEDGTKFLTTKQVAERWARHPESVRRAIREGRMDSVIISRRRLVPVAEVERIEAEGRIARAIH